MLVQRRTIKPALVRCWCYPGRWASSPPHPLTARHLLRVAAVHPPKSPAPPDVYEGSYSGDSRAQARAFCFSVSSLRQKVKDRSSLRRNPGRAEGAASGCERGAHNLYFFSDLSNFIRVSIFWEGNECWLFCFFTCGINIFPRNTCSNPFSAGTVFIRQNLTSVAIPDL